MHEWALIKSIEKACGIITMAMEAIELRRRLSRVFIRENPCIRG
jgi:ribosomal protein L30/L7E